MKYLTARRCQDIAALVLHEMYELIGQLPLHVRVLRGSGASRDAVNVWLEAGVDPFGPRQQVDIPWGGVEHATGVHDMQPTWRDVAAQLAAQYRARVGAGEPIDMREAWDEYESTVLGQRCITTEPSGDQPEKMLVKPEPTSCWERLLGDHDPIGESQVMS